MEGEMIRSSEGFVPKEVVVEEIRRIRGLRRNVAFDVGAGSGYLTVELAKIFKKVYAVERDWSIAEKLRGAARNVGIIVSETPPPVDFEVNLVLFSNVLHELENPAEYLRWAAKADFTVVVEWKADSPLGPRRKIDVKELQRYLTLLSLRELEHHYIAVLQPRQRYP